MSIAKYDEAMWDRIIDTNLKGVFLCMKYELPHIVASKDRSSTWPLSRG